LDGRERETIEGICEERDDEKETRERYPESNFIATLFLFPLFDALLSLPSCSFLFLKPYRAHLDLPKAKKLEKKSSSNW
jgi:hypothetical protein